jgi:hypothetical protein
MSYDDSQSRGIGCAVVAACAFGFVAVVALNFSMGDPGVHLAWEKDFVHPIESDCIEEALRTVVEDVRRTSYVSEGGSFSRGFDRGVTVTQFNYSDPTLRGGYSLDVGRLPNGRTHYWHGWSKIGTDISEEEETEIAPLLNRANEAVAHRCNLSFAGSTPKQGDG